MAPQDPALDALLAELGALDRELVLLVERRGRAALEVAVRVRALGGSAKDAARATTALAPPVASAAGPFDPHELAVVVELVRAQGAALAEREGQPALHVRRGAGEPDRRLVVRGHPIGGAPIVIAGPCAVESAEQIDATAAFLAARGVRFLRGGAYKPRTSPYDFQGLGEPGLALLSAAARAHGLASVTEVLDPRDVERACEHADVLQVGARNMQNFALLREVGRARRPVVLKRGMAATLDEWLLAAEHVLALGNEELILCERGIRTFEPRTRATLDVSAIALLRQDVPFPIVADVSHPAGRRDILVPLARAALAAGAQGLMVEVHPDPVRARSDAQQQLDFPGFDRFLAALWPDGRVPG
ncbi:MAG: bifunctional 3-deoxy-7-phosphoheptulonate synthase/chorismate mutase [Myxococcales bacterium]|nr:bifunctional 3-deoxy-7-phosphoheptulonate synthase/chorismate mutase [Myxococcales bacterium]